MANPREMTREELTKALGSYNRWSVSFSESYTAVEKAGRVGRKPAQLTSSPSVTQPPSPRDRQGAHTYLALRAWTLKKYGLTHETYEAKHVAQGGVCAICEKPETGVREGRVKRLAVDHSRVTGLVRDLLCCRCNQAIGLVFEDPATLRRAAAYIERHRT